MLINRRMGVSFITDFAAFVRNKVESIHDLRYGKIVMMVDADTDGSHICGLLLNFFNQFWPELFELGVLYRFITPIVKVKIGTREKWFYRLSDYYSW